MTRSHKGPSVNCVNKTMKSIPLFYRSANWGWICIRMEALQIVTLQLTQPSGLDRNPFLS